MGEVRADRGYAGIRVLRLVTAIFSLGLTVYPRTVIGTLEFGCHQIDKAKPASWVSGGNYDPENVRQEDCIFACYLQAARRSGLQAGHCMCLSGGDPPEPSSGCGDPCSGDAEQPCGNETHIAIPVYTLPQTPLTVDLTASSGPVIAGQGADLTASGVGLGSSTQLGFEPGDGSLTTWLTSSEMTTHVYLTSGHFLAVVTAQTHSLIITHGAVPVTVTMGTAGVCLQCPVAVEIGQPFDCSVEVVQGPDVTLTVSAGGGDLDPQPLGSPTFGRLGVVGQNGSQTPNAGQAVAWVLPATESLQRARLLAVEALISDVGDGSFTFLILKPSCQTGVYCATDNLCREDSLCKYDSSLHSSPITQDTCDTASTSYCSTKHGCTSSTDPESCPAKPTRFETDANSPIQSKRPGYEIVQVIPMEVSSLGVFRYNFSDSLCELLTLEVGYVLGLAFKVGGAQVGVESEQNTTDTLEYRSTSDPGTLGLGDVFQAADFELDDSRHLVRVITVTPLISRFELTFDAVDDYEITASVTNSITTSGVTDSANVSVQIAITGLLFEDFKKGVEPEEMVIVAVSVVNGSHINYMLDWGDGIVDEIFVADSAPINQSHSYEVAGIYELNITASNLISNETLLVMIEVQNPVQRDHYVITSDSPQVLEADGSAAVVTLTITVENPLNQLMGSDPHASFKCLYEGSCPPVSTADLSSLTSHGQMVDHGLSFMVHGSYTLNITIANHVSQETYQIEVKLYERLTGLNTFTQYKPSASASSFEIVGHGEEKDTFPLDRPVMFRMSYSTGSEVTYVVNFGDGSALGNFSHDEEHPFEHKFPEVGIFTVTIAGSNPVSAAIEITTMVKTLRPIRGVDIIDLGVSQVNKTRHLNLTMGDMGTNSCVVVDFGDGTPTEAYGVCGDHPNKLGHLQPEVPLSHIFRMQDTFAVQAMGYNELSSDNVTVLIPVSEAKHCQLPTVSIQDSKPGWWLPKVATRKDRIVLQGLTQLNCWFTDNSKSWLVEELDPQTGSLKVMQMAELEQVTADTSALVIPAFTLEVGLYRIGYKVTMNKSLTDNLEFSSMGYDYVDLQRSRLIVALIEGQMTSLVKGWGSSLDLIPGELSKDPDIPPDQDQEFESILYLCRRLPSEKFPSEDVYIPIPSEIPDNTTDTSRGGCFGTGPGILNTSMPVLSINTSLMEVGLRYELMVIIKKDIRSGNFSLILELKKGDPPQVAISIGKGTIYIPGRGAQIINPTGNVRLTASCSEFCTGVRYSWEVQGLNALGNVTDLPGWMDWTLGESKYLYIQKELFIHFPQYTLYQITAHGRNVRGGEGYAGMKIQLNEPPVSGTCTVTPQNITVGETVDVDCEGWDDYEGIKWFKFFAKTAAFEANLVNAVKESVVLKPPLGSAEDGYMVSLSVTAEDHIGAKTSVDFANITVNPPVAQRSENFSAEQEKLYEKLMSENNPSAINAQLLLDASLLLAENTQALDDSDASSSQEDEKAIEGKETKRAEKAEVITRMVELQATVSLNSPEDIIVASDTIAIMTYDTSTLSSKALDTLSDVAADVITFVEEDSDATNDESKLNDVGNGLMSFVGNTLAGTGESVQNPIVTTSSGSDQQSGRSEKQQQDMQEKAEATLSQLEDVVQRLYSVVVANKLPGEGLSKFSSPHLELSVERNKASDIGNKTLQDSIGQVGLKDWCKLTAKDGNCSTDDVVDIKLQSRPKNTYNFANGSLSDWRDSGIVNFTFFDNDTQEIFISDLPEADAIEIQFAGVDASAEEEFTVFDVTEGNSSFYHHWELEGVGESVIIKLQPETESAVYALFMSFERRPSFEDYDFKFFIPNVNETGETMSGSRDGQNNVAGDSATNPRVPAAMNPVNSSINGSSTGSTNSSSANGTSETATTGTATMATSPVLDSSTANPPTADSSTNLTAEDPSVNGTANLSTTEIPEATSAKAVIHTLVFGPNHHEGKIGKYFFRLAELAANGTPEENYTMNYSLLILQVQCSYYQSDSRKWSTEGVRVDLDQKTNLPICRTSHLTPFTTSWIVKPIPLDFDLVFSDLSIANNITIYATCGVVYTVFFFIFMWARRKDKKDVMTLGVTPLPDNNPSHSYLYEMVVVTGKRMNAGTDSKVSFILSGDDDETKPRCLEDPKREILCRGGIDRFLLATAKPLGVLNYMRIWHDNSGQGTGQSWYLSYIAIRDLQTAKRYFFICNEWFSLVDGDGQVDRLIPVAGKEQLREFTHVFTSQTGKHFNDSHLWLSIVTRPPGSRFTRMQRAMCCLMALWLEMLTSIMFYEAGTSGPAVKPFNIGPFSLSPSEIAIGIESNLIVFPISLLMVQIFKKSRVRKKRPSRIQTAKEQQQHHKTFGGSSGNKVHPMKTRSDNMDTVSSRDIFIISDNEPKVDTDQSKALVTSHKGAKSKKRQRWGLPWWFIIFGWMFCILVTLTATAFTFFYGLQFGNDKTTSWLHSIVISFFCGIILTQPVKVILVSLFIALVFKTPNSDEETDMEEDEEDCHLQQDEEWLHTLYGSSNVPAAARAPPEPHVIESQRDKRLKELKMYAIIREILFSVIFVWILSVFSYGNQDPFAFWTKNAHVKLLVRGDGNHTFMNATSIPKFWKWVNTGLVPGMFAGPYYNNKQPSADEKDFLGDRYSKILGKVMFRQLRVPKGDCEVNFKIKNIIHECNTGYSLGGQDEASYGIGWTPFDPTVPSYPQYNYTDASKLGSYPVWGRHALYLGGGYVYYIDTDSLESVRGTFKRMYEEAWIDKYTRVLFIEFSVYNAQTNLFSFINLMMEILPTGGSYPHYRIDVLRLLTYHEGIGLVRVICEAAFFVFIICLTIKEAFLIRKERKKYFKQFWNLNELAIIIFSIVTMVVYFFRLFVTNGLLDIFADKERQEHINLQYVAYWNELMGYMLGLVVFLSTLKFLKLLRFNRRIGLLSSTIRSCSEELLNFTFMFFFVFVAFASAFYLIFCNRLLNYSDILFTMETMITAVLGKFKFGELLVTESVLGPLFFFGFTGYVCFIMINVFLTIIIGAFKTVKEDIEQQSNEYEMVDFILNRFRSFTGIGKKRKAEEEDIPNLDMEEYNADIAKSLPEKVDQLLDRIAHTYFDQGTFNDFVKEVKAEEKKKEKSGRKIYLS